MELFAVLFFLIMMVFFAFTTGQNEKIAHKAALGIFICLVVYNLVKATFGVFCLILATIICLFTLGKWQDKPLNKDIRNENS